jgi:HB1/ASXL restriction endonuclease-like protein with HTH domain
MSKKKNAAQKTALQVKKDGKGRFWLIPKDGGAEQGPFDTKKETLDAKAGATAATNGKAIKPAKAKKTKEPKAKKVGALDAAAQVLAGSKEAMNCKALIEAMAKKGLWTSPVGKTPHATLYSAIIREIATKGKESRFVKKDRGQFAAA